MVNVRSCSLFAQSSLHRRDALL